ncbi:MAG: cytochrome c oxidase subunit 2A [Trueperaceae bacterium]|nr:MAG: cytochrome c oxidase subunit 2A [Trueperaceae bacterium]
MHPACRDYNGAQHECAGVPGGRYVEQDKQHDDGRTERPVEGPPPDTEQRPLGALAVTGFLTVTILVMWFGMYALNMARS